MLKQKTEESVTCIGMKEDRHQNTTSSVALKQGVGEPWKIERVVRFIDVFVCREVTLKSDTEPAVTVFRNRVAGCVQGRQSIERAHRTQFCCHRESQNNPTPQ